MSDTPVLIAGAGPTGLVLALSLARRGVPFRLIDAADGPGERSRAVVVHARTLELYDQFGLAQEVLARGVPMRDIRLRQGGDAHGAGRELLHADLSRLNDGLSPFNVVAFPQDDHERLLVETLAAEGVEVERRTRLVGLEPGVDGVRATLERDGRTETVATDWLAGCDGAHSAVRHALGIGFPGGEYQELFYVADVRVTGASNADLVGNLGAQTLLIMFPVRSTGMQRLIGLAPSALSQRDGLTFDDLRAGVETLAGVTVEEVNWFSTYRVHHRVADRFRDGRVFLLGDAGHIHSPAGGQGMNTGIGDAVNLGWKLAEVVRGRAQASLLDSYEPERIAFARKLVATTDRLFRGMVDAGAAGRFARRLLAPLVMGVGVQVEPVRHALFRALSQIAIRYPTSPLSEGGAGRVHGGDRLPWTGAEGDPDDFAPLRSLDWQVHVHGEASTALRAAAQALGAPLHAFSWSEAAHRAGFARDAAYLVRPDGYVALAAGGGEAAEALGRYSRGRGLKLG